MNEFANDLSCRPNTPAKTLWFEFLLAPSLLEQHLSLPISDPPPTELIVQLLNNILPSTHNEQNTNLSLVYSPLNAPPPLIPTSSGPLPVQETEGIPPAASPENEVETKKGLALKLLALKVAAFLKWDLNVLEKALPLPIQERLITELQKVVTPPGKVSGEEPVKASSLTPDELFAEILYNRWILRSVVMSSYPVRGQKGLTVQIPGQIDPTYVPQDVMDSIIRKLSEKSEQACISLEEILKQRLPVRMPLFSCLGVVSEESPNPNHDWENGIMLLIDDVECQVSYDLGCYYFHKEKYQRAGDMFSRASSFSKSKDNIYCQINEAKLKGYCGACTHLLNQQSSLSMSSLQERFQSSMVNGYKDTVAILAEDNLKREIPLALRDALEMDVLQKEEQINDICMKVIGLNAIRKIIAGHVIHMNFHIALENNESKMMDIILEGIKSVLPSLSIQQKNLMKNAVRMLYHFSSSIASALTSSDIIKSIFNQSEIERLCNNSNSINQSTLQTDKQNFTDDPSTKVGQLERELLSASMPDAICSLIKQLQLLSSVKPLWTLNHKWELPRHLASLVRSTHSPEIVYILLAKASELRAIKNYAQARELYKMAQEEIRIASSRLSRLIGWELLHTDLLETTETPSYKLQHHKQQCQEILQKAKSCIKAYYQERDAPPDSFLVDLCAIVLLNLHEWDALNEFERRHGYMELSYLLSAVCRDICANKGSRTPPRDLWDAVVPIFSNSGGQYKRSSSGVIKDPQRDSSHGIMSRASFLQFIIKLTDTLVLTVIISCLTKLYNILKDSSNGEVCLEYSLLWPSVVNNSSMYSIQMVTDALHETLQHALSVHPAHSSWLKTRGDFMYVQTHYAAAMKNYLSAAMVSSDYFSQTLPRALFDDTQYKHMIHCCTKLHCHTQAAILGQCLEEPNYQAVFKSLGEKVCNDSCDTYYPCIWDVTLLEYLINLHARRGEVDRRQLAVQLIGQLELNSNNNEEIQHEAANIRRGKFFRAIAKQYL